MPRAFLVKPRPLEQMRVTSESSRDTSPWLQVDCDVNNNSVGRSTSTLFRPPALDLTTVRPTDDLARWSFDVGGGLHWWSMPQPRSAAIITQRSQDTRGGRSHDVTSSAERSRSPSASSAAAAAAAVDEEARHLWWSSSPQSDVSASGRPIVFLFVSFTSYYVYRSRVKCDSMMCGFCNLRKYSSSV